MVAEAMELELCGGGSRLDAFSAAEYILGTLVMAPSAARA